MIKSKYRLFSIYVLGAIVMTACSFSYKPLNRDVMVEVISDLYLTESMINVSGDDVIKNNRDRLEEGIYSKYNTNKEEFLTSLNWYADNIKDYMQISDSVVEKLRREQKVISDFRDLELKLLYAFDVQMDKPQIRHLNLNSTHLFFKIDSMKIQRMAQDELEGFRWNFSSLGLQSKEKLSLNISFIYTDTSIYILDTLNSDTVQYLVNKPIIRPDSLLRNISGSLNLHNASATSNVLLYNIEYQDPSTKIRVDSLVVENS